MHYPVPMHTRSDGARKRDADGALRASQRRTAAMRWGLLRRCMDTARTWHDWARRGKDEESGRDWLMLGISSGEELARLCRYGR